MARSDEKNIFLIISGDKGRISSCSDALSKNFPHTSVFQAGDWFDAKYKLDNVHPKVILIDEYLPKGSGFDIVGKILKEKNNNDIKIVIMSYIADHDIFAHEVEKGRIHYLTEPDREQCVVDCISKIISPKVEAKPPQAQFQLRQLGPGDFLFKEGENSELVYIVKNGKLQAYSMVDGTKILLGVIAAGEFVGEMGHFNHEPRSATVEALTDVELIEIPHSALENVIFSRPSWSKALVKTLAQRLKRANKALTG